MSTPEKSEAANNLDVEAGNRAVDVVVIVLGAAAFAGLTEAVFDFSDEISASAAYGLSSLLAGSAFFLWYVNRRDRGDSSVS